MSSVTTTVLTDATSSVTSDGAAVDGPETLVHLLPAAQALQRFVEFAFEQMDWGRPDRVREHLAASSLCGMCRVVETQTPDTPDMPETPGTPNSSSSCRVYFDYPLCLSPDLVASLPPFAFYVRPSSQLRRLPRILCKPFKFCATFPGTDITLEADILSAGFIADFSFSCICDQRVVPVGLLSVPDATSVINAVSYFATTYPARSFLAIPAYPARDDIIELFEAMPPNVLMMFAL